MSDQSIFASCITLCGLTCFSAIEPWCNTKRYGCECCSCGGERGFCHSCFDRSFNHDSWDREESEQRRPIDPSNTEPPAADSMETGVATTKEQNGEKELNTEQPQPMAEMNPSNPVNSQSP